MKQFLSAFKKSVSAITIAAVIVVSVAFVPLTKEGELQQAHAVLGGGPVIVAGGIGTIQETISAGADTFVAGVQASLQLKEITFDSIFNALAKMVLKSITQSILTWINSGFQGSPAFVTDLKQFLSDQADAIVGDFLYNDPSLNFLCSPFELDVKIALVVDYQEQAYGGFDEAQCTLSGAVENVEGFLSGDSFNPQNWFEITQNPTNTPTGALLEAQGELYARIADAEGNTVQELEWGQGFLSFKVCSDTSVANGTQTDCDITTPGQVIADQINKTLGASQDALIEADEINEVIGAFFAQVAQMAITGVGGLLGLSGGSGGFVSADGTRYDSYLDALGQEGSEAGTIENPLEEAITREEEHIALQNEVIDEINNVETYLESREALYPTCLNLSLPTDLETRRDEGIAAVIASTSVLPILTSLSEQFATSTDPQEQLEVISTYTQLQDAGFTVDISANNLLEVYIDYELREEIANFISQINSRVRQCDDDD